MAAPKVEEASKEAPKVEEAEWTPEVIGTDLVKAVVSTKRPVFADAAGKVLEQFKESLESGGKSDWMLIGSMSDTKIRSAFKFHGWSVGFGETKEETPRKVFRVIGRYESREEKKERLAAEEAAKVAEQAASEEATSAA